MTLDLPKPTPFPTVPSIPHMPPRSALLLALHTVLNLFCTRQPNGTIPPPPPQAYFICSRTRSSCTKARTSRPSSSAPSSRGKMGRLCQPAGYRRYSPGGIPGGRTAKGGKWNKMIVILGHNSICNFCGPGSMTNLRMVGNRSSPVRTLRY